MKNKYYPNSIIFVLLLLIFYGCSTESGVRTPYQYALERADRHYKNAEQLAKMNDNKSALQSLKMAYEEYTFIDYGKGKILSALAIAEKYLEFGEDDKTLIWLDNARNSRTDNNLCTEQFMLVQTEYDFYHKNYQAIIDTYKEFDIDDLDEEYQAQLWTFYVLSLMRSYINYEDQFDDLIDYYDDIRDLYEDEELNKISAFSFVAYSIGYIYMKQKNWEEAYEYLQEAELADKTYGYHRALADDLAAIATVLKNQNKLQSAIHKYESAADIYNFLKFEDKANQMLHKARILRMQRFLPPLIR